MNNCAMAYLAPPEPATSWSRLAHRRLAGDLASYLPVRAALYYSRIGPICVLAVAHHKRQGHNLAGAAIR